MFQGKTESCQQEATFSFLIAFLIISLDSGSYSLSVGHHFHLFTKRQQMEQNVSTQDSHFKHIKYFTEDKKEKPNRP